MAETNMSDKVLVESMRKAVDQVASLMTEAKRRNIVMVFNISEVILEEVGPKFQAVVDIKRIEPL